MAKNKRIRGRPPQSPGQSAVSREAKDILLKFQAATLGGGFLASLGLDLPPIVEALPAELPVLEVRLEQPDRLFRLADRSILHLEFQMSSDEDDLSRFYDYHYAASKLYRAAVYTVVLYGPGIDDARSVLRRGSVVYTARNVYIGQQDGEALLQEVRATLTREGTLSEADRARLTLFPLMAHRRPLPDALRDAITVARMLPAGERVDVMGTMLGLAYNYVGQQIIDQLIMGGQEMANALEELIEQALVRAHAEHAEAEQRIMVESKREDILSILATRFGAVPRPIQERIGEITDLASLRALVPSTASTSSLEEFAHLLNGVDR